MNNQNHPQTSHDSLTIHLRLQQLINAMITSITAIKAIGSHIGLNTHSHDQLMKPINFNAINSKHNIPINPVPELLFSFFISILL